MIHRILILLKALFMGMPPPVKRKPGNLPYNDLYFCELNRVRKSIFYFSDEYEIVESYKEMSFYALMHQPRQWTGWKTYEYQDQLRKVYGLRLSKLNLN